MSTTPAIYQGPKIAEDVPASTRFHLQQIYQKLGNHYQGIALLREMVGATTEQAAPAPTVTSVGGGGTGTGTLPSNEILLGQGASPIAGMPSVSPGYVATDNGPGTVPTFKFPFTAAPQYAYAALPGSPTLGQVVCVTDSTVNTWGATITVGGGTHFVLAWFNSVNWTVVGA